MKQVNLALIGVSGFAGYHFREAMCWHREGRIRLVAATIINPEQEPEKVDALRETSCEIFGDYKAMLAKRGAEIDLCIIPTGIHLHTEMTLAALAAGCNVLLEKPVAATLQEVDQMEAAAKKAGKVLAIGFQHMYSAEVGEIKRAILNGLLGEIQCIKSMGLWPRAESYYQRNNWAGRMKCGDRWVLDSPFTNAFAHWVNLMCFLAGDEFGTSAAPRSVCSELYRANPIETTDTACLRIEAETGIPLYLWVSHCCAEAINPMLEIRGSKGSIFWDDRRVVLRQDGCETLLMPASSNDRCRTNMYGAIIDKIHGGPSLICDIAIARNQTFCVDGVFESAEIRTIPEAFYEIAPNDGDPLVCIHGIGETFRNAFAEEKLFSEMSVEWASEPGFADLRGYTRFSGMAKLAEPVG